MRPWEHRQTQVYGRRVQRIDGVGQFQAQVLGGVESPGLCNQPLGKLSADAPVRVCVGVRRSTLADANEIRDWWIYAEFAQRLIAQARRLYAAEDLSLELTNTVYALDSTTIDLCLSLFPWAHFRSTKAAVKMHTLLDLRGSIPSFIQDRQN